MSTAIGRNTANGQKLLAVIESIERIRESKKQLGDDEKVKFAEAQSEGFTAKRIRDCLKIRAMNPHEREEAEAELDMYLHAIGMSSEAPLFRAVGLMNVDTTVREQVIDAVKLLVPVGGEFVLKIGGSPVRVWRDDKGTAFAEDVKEEKKPAAPKSGGFQSPPRGDVPQADADGAEALGREAYRAGLPIIRNPFPWDDPRRARWDGGWRSESGGDGMGPDSED